MPELNNAAPASTPRGLALEVIPVSASFTWDATYKNRVIRSDAGSGITITLPFDAEIGSSSLIHQSGAGAVTVAAGSNATLSSSSGVTATGTQYDTIEIVCVKAGIWTVRGMGTGTFPGAVNITGGDTNITTTSASTDGGTSVEPVLVSTTMTGAGGVGGRMRSLLTVSAALAGWSNAFKGEVVYGAAGKTTGLGSAVLAEMTLSAGTADGNYAPVEVELNLGTGALTGTATALAYMSVNGADASTFDTNGFVFNLQGLTAASGKCLQTGNTFGTPAATLKVKVGGTTYYLPLYAAEITTV